MQQFNIDISQPRGPLVIYASQADSYSRFFSVTVTDNGAAYAPPAGSIFTVRFGAPGLPAGWYDTITEQGGGTHPAVVVDENTYTVEIAEQALGTPGENALVLIVSDATGYTLASWAFMLQVAGVPGYDAPEATVYYNALSEQVAQVLANAQAAAASAAQAAASAAQAAESATSIDPSTLVKKVNGETPVAGAVSVTTRNLAYRVGDTITTTDAGFDPNSAVGGTWVQHILHSKDTPLANVSLLNGATGDCLYIVRNGWCSVFFNSLVWTGYDIVIASGLPPAAITTAISDNSGLHVSITTGSDSVTAYTAISNNPVFYNLVYPVLDTFSIPLYVWTKTE